jgi:hypothetical protein
MAVGASVGEERDHSACSALNGVRRKNVKMLSGINKLKQR